ncbi:MAG TPA: LytTR family DNA-binding domain-containing protein [Pyrinomonadaceae bacterium]|nr:LytTR family DNA-binding domain-containing protein [Pyrinomonadaceae bacterium]
MNKVRTLVVDDEPPARRRVRKFLAEMNDVELIGECADGPEAVGAIREYAPDLVLLDVQMPKMGGFEVIREVGVESVPAVIFVTAYDRFAVQAFEIHALDYLLKPFTRLRLAHALERAKAQMAAFGGRLQELIKTLDGRAGYLERVAVKLRDRIIFVPVGEIDWIEADGDCALLHAGKKTHAVRESLGVLGCRLDPDKFVRAHRSTIVNVERVREMIPQFCGDQTLVLRDGTRLTLSRTHRDELLSRINGKP